MYFDLDKYFKYVSNYYLLTFHLKLISLSSKIKAEVMNWDKIFRLFKNKIIILFIKNVFFPKNITLNRLKIKTA